MNWELFCTILRGFVVALLLVVPPEFAVELSMPLRFLTEPEISLPSLVFDSSSLTEENLDDIERAEDLI